MFFRMNGELFKRLIALDHGAWVISYDDLGRRNTSRLPSWRPVRR
ncbi:MAG: hypothetical protein ACLUKO_26345 [Enterocloster bolteae]